MGMKEYTWQQASKAVKASKRQLKGERVAILRDKAADTFGDGLIVRPETYKNEPLSGRVVAIGTEVPEDAGYYIGQEVNFNKYAVNGFSLSLEGFSDPFEFDVLHTRDIYWVVSK